MTWAEYFALLDWPRVAAALVLAWVYLAGLITVHRTLIEVDLEEWLG